MAAKTTTKKKPEPKPESVRDRLAATKWAIPARIVRGTVLTVRILWIWREAVPLPILAAAALLPSSGVVRLLAAAILAILITSPVYWRGPIGKNVHDSWQLRLKRCWRDDCDALKITGVGRNGKTVYPKVRIKVGPMTGWTELVDAITAPHPRNLLTPWRFRLPIRDAFKPDWLQYQITPLPLQYEEKLRSHLEEGLRRLRRYKDVDSASAGDDWIIMLVMAQLEDRVEFSMPDDNLDLEGLFKLPAAGETEAA
jgi:hypothetical protein